MGRTGEFLGGKEGGTRGMQVQQHEHMAKSYPSLVPLHALVLLQRKSWHRTEESHWGCERLP